MPGVVHVPRGGGALVPGDKNVIVFHTTETDRQASYEGNEPHFEVYGSEAVSDAQAIRQFIPLDSPAKALWNEKGGVETNRRAGNVWQIEIVWRAGNARNMPDLLLNRLAQTVRFIRSQGEVPLAGPPQGWWMPGTIAVVDSPLRFSWADWNAYAGFCAHANVPENDHWDAGDFPWDRFVQILTQSEGGLTMADVDAILAKIQNTHDFLGRLASGKDSVPDFQGSAKDFHSLIESISRRVEDWGAFLNEKISLLGATGSLSQADVQRIAKAVVDEIAS